MHEFQLWQAKKANKSNSKNSLQLSRQSSKPCKHCQKTGHFPYQCQQSPKKPKRIKQRGKHSYKWQDTRQQWIANNPPSHDGTWRCELNISPWCLVRIDIDQLTIDHKLNRSSNPKLRYTQSNLKPACVYCNNMKGSKII